MMSPAARDNRRLGFSAVTYMSMALLQRGSSLILLPFVTRVLSPDEYGQISIVVAMSALLGVVLGAALEMAVFRWSARDDQGSDQVLRVCQAYLYCVVPGIGAVLALILWMSNREILGIDSRIWSIEALAAALLPAMSFFALPTVRARDQLAKYVALAGCSVVLLAVGKVILVIVFDLGLKGWVISDCAAAILSYLLAVALVRVPKASMNSAAVRKVMRFSLPLLPHRLSFWALSSLSRPAMLIVMSLAQIGLFSLALNIAAVANMALSELNRAVLIEYSREGFPAPSSLTRKVAQAQILASFAIPAAIAAGVTLFHTFLFDSRYNDVLVLTAVLLLAQVAFGLYLIPMNYIVQSAAITGWSWLASVMGALTIFLSVFVLGSRFGSQGVAWGTSAGYTIMLVVAVALTRKLGLTIVWHRVMPGLLCLTLSVVAFVFCSLSLVYAESQLSVGRGLVVCGAGCMAAVAVKILHGFRRK